jgi:hypothetical protein
LSHITSVHHRATVRTADELKELWASPKGKDVLRKRNKRMEILPSYPENTDLLDEYLQNDDDVDSNIFPEIVEKTLERKRGQEEPFDEIVVQRPCR